MSLEIEGATAQPSSIDLYALCGSFHVQGSPYVVRYASTHTNPRSQGGHRELLRELKPVRERLRSRELRNLSSLLQRDLNDSRVSQDLIPYLVDNSDVGFFPAILAVLVPKNYLHTDKDVEYPEPNPVDLVTNYDGCWSVQHFKIGGEVVPFGLLKIFTGKSEIIVLDGQHRGNAFRYVAGDFPPQDSIYEAFYQGQAQVEPLDSDLPVTLIWFEREGGGSIDPRLVSRRLFVDVNNSAKPVSRARTILLDDRSLTAVATQEVYNHAAERGFDSAKFSLLHSAFDMDSDLAKSKMSEFALTTPEIVETSLMWGLLATPTWDSLSRWKVGAQHDQKHKDRLFSIVGSMTGVEELSDDDHRWLAFESREVADEFRARFRESYLPVFSYLLDNFLLSTLHHSAGVRVEEWVNNEADTFVRDAWENVFCGGEGLYWSFQSAAKDTQRAKGYKDAIAKIEKRFSEERAAALESNRSDTDSAFGSFRTKAFQSGFVMAVDYLASIGDGDRLAAAEKLVTELNSFSAKQWLVILGDLRAALISDTNPKAWPAYRTLLVRLFDGDEWNLFAPERRDSLPEWQVLQRKITDYASSVANSQEEVPDSEELGRQVAIRVEETRELFDRAGLGGGFPNAKLEKFAKTHLAQQLADRLETSEFDFG